MEVTKLDKHIEKLKEILKALEKEYEIALQREGEAQIAYRDGYIDGLERAIEELEVLQC